MIDAAVVGVGLGGRAFHAPIIHAVPGLRLAAILQRHGDDAQKIYPDAKIVRDLDELLAMKSISLIAERRQTKHIFRLLKVSGRDGTSAVVDKPFTTTRGSAR
jgi:scyllo-inositol 2-dehydrogenase (NADP+)